MTLLPPGVCHVFQVGVRSLKTIFFMFKLCFLTSSILLSTMPSKSLLESHVHARCGRNWVKLCKCPYTSFFLYLMLFGFMWMIESIQFLILETHLTDLTRVYPWRVRAPQRRIGRNPDSQILVTTSEDESPVEGRRRALAAWAVSNERPGPPITRVEDFLAVQNTRLVSILEFF